MSRGEKNINSSCVLMNGGDAAASLGVTEVALDGRSSKRAATELSQANDSQKFS